MTVVMFRQIIECKQKKWQWPIRDLALANSTNGTVRCSLTLKNKKCIRKEYLAIIFFLRAIKDLSFKQVRKYARLKNNNWTILEFIWNNSDTFNELIQHSTTHFCHNLYITILTLWDSYYQTTLHTFLSFYITKYISGSCYKIILHIFSGFISNNIHVSRVTTKHYYKIILF